jgi:hypothetical protein
VGTHKESEPSERGSLTTPGGRQRTRPLASRNDFSLP